MPSPQARYWILTIPEARWTPCLPDGCQWVRGQLECSDGDYRHWQLVVSFAQKVTLSRVRDIFGPVHAERTRSAAAIAYVWKEDTRVPDSQFEFGERRMQRSSSTDWEGVWNNAVAGNILGIPADIRIRCYRTLKDIRADNARPIALERSCTVLWGSTGTGKSRRAFEEAGVDAYYKDPRTKFWCGYRGEKNVVLDEFRGAIDIAHLLRWLDRYPVTVELKGSSTPLLSERFWITSNLHPDHWYPDVDPSTREALIRRLTIVNLE